MTRDLSLAAAPIPPQQGAIGTLDTGGVDFTKFLRALFVLETGVFAVGATLDMKLQESNDATFAVGTTDITGAAITQLLAAGGNNRQATIEVKKSQLTKRYVRARVEVAVDTVFLSVLPLAGNEASSPASGSDVASVAQRKTLTTGLATVYTPSGLQVNDL
jgi:hypothetical protein